MMNHPVNLESIQFSKILKKEKEGLVRWLIKMRLKKDKKLKEIEDRFEEWNGSKG